MCEIIKDSCMLLFLAYYTLYGSSRCYYWPNAVVWRLEMLLNILQHLGQYSTAEAGSVGVSKAEFSTSALGHSYTFSSPSASRMSKVGLSDCKECVYSSY